MSGVIRAVLFDLDGTLVNSERQNADAVERVLGRRGRAMTAEEREFVIGHGWREIHAFLAGRGVELTLEVLMAESAREREALAAAEGLHVLPDAVPAVERIARRFPTAVVSGSSRAEVAWCLGALGLRDRVRFFVAAEDTSRGKPHPDGYLLAATRLGVAPAECVTIEDSTAGIAAARAAGMRCVAVRAGNFAGQRQDGADRIIDTLESLDEALIASLGDQGAA